MKISIFRVVAMDSKISNFVKRMENGISVLNKLTEDLNVQHYLDHPVPGKWSILECLCHIVDFEIINAERIKRIIGENNPLIMSADETMLAKNLFYNKRNPETEIYVFLSVRKHLVDIISNIKIEDLEKTPK